ncbi:KR domain-containing protein [Sesbania bispinosa]|nr:KR domain-containing protein [Sesbania bispinosa]
MEAVDGGSAKGGASRLAAAAMQQQRKGRLAASRGEKVKDRQAVARVRVAIAAFRDQKRIKWFPVTDFALQGGDELET